MKEGISVAAITGICLGFASIYYTKVLDPTHLLTLAEQGRAELVAQGRTEEQIDDAMNNFYSFSFMVGNTNKQGGAIFGDRCDLLYVHHLLDQASPNQRLIFQEVFGKIFQNNSAKIP